jgi:hypothetical protein
LPGISLTAFSSLQQGKVSVGIMDDDLSCPFHHRGFVPLVPDVGFLTLNRSCSASLYLVPLHLLYGLSTWALTCLNIQGCRAGSACPYVHDPLVSEITRSQNQPSAESSRKLPEAGSTEESSRSSSIPLRTVQKPVSLAERENPREFQINQIRRKFRPTESPDAAGTRLRFIMVPTDPDFHFDVKEFQCELTVPFGYPNLEAQPSLEVLNEALDARLRLRVQQQFEHIIKTSPTRSLLGWMNRLDRDLAGIVTLPTSGSAHISDQSQTSQRLTAAQPETETAHREKRQREIMQLVARLGRTPLFKAHADGVSFTIPVKPTRAGELPSVLRPLKTVTLIVPLTYPSDPCRIKLDDVKGEPVDAIEETFTQHALHNPDMSLMARMNYLATTMHKMTSPPAKTDAAGHSADFMTATAPVDEPPSALQSLHDKSKPLASRPLSPDRPHVQVIPRPPEWTTGHAGGDGGSASNLSDDSWSEGSLSEGEDHDADDDDDGGVRVPEASAPESGRRVLLSFPNLDLYGIELLAVGNLSLTVKCERCKVLNDVKGIKIGDDGSSVPATRTVVCEKCSSYLSVGTDIPCR